MLIADVEMQAVVRLNLPRSASAERSPTPSALDFVLPDVSAVRWLLN